jgi:LmbE family N-acetylglucosaminyl deacetylase
MLESNNTIDFFVPDGSPVADALSRTTHLAVVAHQDDLEINCFAGITQCYQRPDQWFTGIVMSDGAGSPRSGQYAEVSDDEMVEIRKREQHRAAALGQYSLVIQYGASSAALKGPYESTMTSQLAKWLETTAPDVVYLHNLADRHDTHVRVAMYALEALRSLGDNKRPRAVLGVEGWGNLDWLPEPYRVRLNVGQHRQLHDELIRVFDSQVAGGKRYDLACESRHLANATFDQSHSVDSAEYISLAMDLNPLLADARLNFNDYLASIVQKFSADLMPRLAPWSAT